MTETDPLALLKAAQERAARQPLADPRSGDAAERAAAATVPETVPGDVGAPEPDVPTVAAADGPEGPTDLDPPDVDNVDVDTLDADTLDADAFDADTRAAVGGGGVATAKRSALDDVEATGARRKRRRHSTTRNLVEWLVVIAGALLVALVVKTWLFQAFYIPSGSMEPTLHIDDRVLVNKVSYDLEDVERGDIVVFERPEDWGTGEIDDLIKRVVALPGETVSVVDGAVLIDGDPLDESWLEDGVTTPSFFPESGCVPECTVPDDAVFVLGDNRGNSDASNHFGPLPFDQVVGRAFLRVWPLGDVGTL